jgi:hypothetical protein
VALQPEQHPNSVPVNKLEIAEFEVEFVFPQRSVTGGAHFRDPRADQPTFHV